VINTLLVLLLALYHTHRSAYMLFTLDAEKYPVDMMKAFIDW
jgi:hypothetical protein